MPAVGVLEAIVAFEIPDERAQLGEFSVWRELREALGPVSGLGEVFHQIIANDIVRQPPPHLDGQRVVVGFFDNIQIPPREKPHGNISQRRQLRICEILGIHNPTPRQLSRRHNPSQIPSHVLLLLHAVLGKIFRTLPSIVQNQQTRRRTTLHERFQSGLDSFRFNLRVKRVPRTPSKDVERRRQRLLFAHAERAQTILTDILNSQLATKLSEIT